MITLCNNKKLGFVGMFFLCVMPIWAYEASLEQVLSTKPSIDITEYVLITHNNLEQTLVFLDKQEQKIKAANTSTVEKKIRQIHLRYLRAYAYAYHEGFDLKKNKKAKDDIMWVIKEAEPILKQYPRYSDLRRVLAVSMMLFAKIGGIVSFFDYKERALNLAEESMKLNPNNPMARVVINNFDMLAIKLIGANVGRGYDAILIPAQEQWAKPQKFEFYISQLYALLKARNKEKAQQVFNKAKKLYPNSWRLHEFTKYF